MANDTEFTPEEREDIRRMRAEWKRDRTNAAQEEAARLTKELAGKHGRRR